MAVVNLSAVEEIVSGDEDIEGSVNLQTQFVAFFNKITQLVEI